MYEEHHESSSGNDIATTRPSLQALMLHEDEAYGNKLRDVTPNGRCDMRRRVGLSRSWVEHFRDRALVRRRPDIWGRPSGL
jgi:hypothetical protein